MHDRVAEFADADLDRAAVPHEQACGERDRMVGGRDRPVRRGDQLVIAARIVDDEVEIRGRKLGRAEHVRHAVIDLADDRDRRAGTLPLVQHRDQVRRDVRVRAETQAIARGVAPPRDLLRDDIRAFGGDRARDMRVVDARIGLLRERRGEPGARLHEEFLHADVRGKPSRADRADPGRLRRIAEDARRDRLDEAPFEFALRPRAREREAGEDRKLDAGIRRRATVELVDERDRLARADRRAEDDFPADARECLLDAVLDACELPRLPPVHGRDSS